MGYADLVRLIERRHDERAGVPRDVIREYARTLESRRDFSFSADAFVRTVDDRVTDADSWNGYDVFYSLDADRISQYPSRWHDRLGDSLDVEAYLAFIQDDAPEFGDDTGHSGAGSGIPEDTLLDVMAVVGRVDREEAKAALQQARDRGDVVEDVDQHPQADVYLRDEADDLRDETLDG